MGQKSRKKVCILLVAGIVLSVAALIWASLTVVAYFMYKAEKPQKEYKYASKYDLPIGGKGKSENGNWNVYKEDKYGVIYLSVWHIGAKTRETDYMDFEIYNSSADARKCFEKEYRNNSDYITEEGDNWYIYDVPGVCDAYIKRMLYLENNIIISAEVEITSAWGECYPDDFGDTTTTTTTETKVIDRTDPAGGYYDRKNLIDYIIFHAPEIRAYVLDDVFDSEKTDREILESLKEH